MSFLTQFFVAISAASSRIRRQDQGLRDLISEFNESPFEELFGTTAASFPDLLDLGTTAEIDIDGFLNMDTTEVPEFLFTTPDTEIMFSTAGLLLPEETTPFVLAVGSETSAFPSELPPVPTEDLLIGSSLEAILASTAEPWSNTVTITNMSKQNVTQAVTEATPTKTNSIFDTFKESIYIRNNKSAEAEGEIESTSLTPVSLDSELTLTSILNLTNTATVTRLATTASANEVSTIVTKSTITTTTTTAPTTAATTTTPTTPDFFDLIEKLQPTTNSTSLTSTSALQPLTTLFDDNVSSTSLSSTTPNVAIPPFQGTVNTETSTTEETSTIKLETSQAPLSTTTFIPETEVKTDSSTTTQTNTLVLTSSSLTTESPTSESTAIESTTSAPASDETLSSTSSAVNGSTSTEAEQTTNSSPTQNSTVMLVTVRTDRPSSESRAVAAMMWLILASLLLFV